MSDDWEEDFVVPDLIKKLEESNKSAFDGEDEEEHGAPQAVSPKNAQASAAAQQKAKEEDIKLANKLKLAKLENLSESDKRLMERKLVEEADNRLAGELFGGTSDQQVSSEEMIAQGLGSIPIKTKQDHIDFAILCANKMDESTAFNITAYYKELTNQLKVKFTFEGVEEVIKTLTVIRDEKKKTVAPKVVKKTAKEVKEYNKKGADLFGGDEVFGDSKYDYNDDDFM